MVRQQKQAMESFVRVRAFLDEHPVTGPLNYGDARESLDDAMQRLREYGGAQVSGRELSRAELRRQRQLIGRLKDRHMRPIVTIARAQIEPGSDVRLPVALRMPRNAIGVTRMLQACEGMIEAARPFEAVFIEKGLPADFLAQFSAARDQLERVLGGRAAMVGSHVGARQGLHVEVRRGRRAVDRLDAVVRAAFEGDLVVLTRWRSAKRLQRMPGGPGAPEPVAEVVPAVAA